MLTRGGHLGAGVRSRSLSGAAFHSLSLQPPPPPWAVVLEGLGVLLRLGPGTVGR